MEDKIDFVILWVDGNDPNWQEERNKYRNDIHNDNRAVRFRDWDNLKYWFRGVEKYAPWVNKIHFVTWGHLPEFLNTNNSKLNIVNHKDFIPEKYLPTFNSNTIELNLHRIKGLQEQFVYFNDDVFVINDVKPTDFFRNGKPCDTAILSPIIKEDKMGIASIQVNNMGIINHYYKKNIQIKKNFSKFFNFKYGMQNIKSILLYPWENFTGFYQFHITSNLLKSTYEELWNKENEELDYTCSHKFRDLRQDLNQWLIKDWQLASGNFNPRKYHFGKLYMLQNENDAKKIFKNNKYKVICLNDSEHISEETFEKLRDDIKEQFDNLFPDKCSFEK